MTLCRIIVWWTIVDAQNWWSAQAVLCTDQIATVQPLDGKGPRPLLLTGLRATCEKIRIILLPNHQNYFVFLYRIHNLIRQCATSRKVVGSIPDDVIGIFFHSHNPSGRTMALGFTQLLTEMSIRNTSISYFLGVKTAGAFGWQPYHLHVPIVLKYGSLSLMELSEPVQSCNGIALPLIFT